MTEKNQQTQSTDLLLGEIKGAVKAIDKKLTVQNGAINEMRKSINGLSHRIDGLPCDIQDERLSTHLATAAKENERESLTQQEKKRSRRDLLIALGASFVTGAFMLIGIWFSRGAPMP